MVVSAVTVIFFTCVYNTRSLLSTQKNVGVLVCDVGCLKVCSSPENVHLLPLRHLLEAELGWVMLIWQVYKCSLWVDWAQSFTALSTYFLSCKTVPDCRRR